MFYMFGPEVGRRHYMTLFRQSGLNEQLVENLSLQDRQYCLYGDAAYVLRPWLQVAFRTHGSPANQLLYNEMMSSVREAVECTYKDLQKMWASQDFKRMLKVRQSPLAMLYKTAALI